MQVLISDQTIDVYTVDVCSEDLWMDVGDFLGTYRMETIPTDLAPGLYCILSESIGTTVMFNTGEIVYQVDLGEDQQFLAYYEALDEEVSPEHINELYQLSIL